MTTGVRIRRFGTAAALAAALQGTALGAPRQQPALDPFVSVPAGVIALINGRVVDGTGSPARSGPPRR